MQLSHILKNGMAGTSDITFAPDAPSNRAMIVAILYRLEGSPAVNGNNIFNDINEGTWYTDAVKWASENGIVSGFGNGIFKPMENITSEQLVSILMRYAQYKGYDMNSEVDKLQFGENAVSTWAEDSVRWAVAHDIIQSNGASAVVPKMDAVRAQMAWILMNFCENVAK